MRIKVREIRAIWAAIGPDLHLFHGRTVPKRSQTVPILYLDVTICTPYRPRIGR